MAEPAFVRPEDLLAHAGWVRRLAASLVRDHSTADDLVQETWVAAMENPPDGDRPVRPWLGAVLRNLWRQHRRGEGRRARREAAAARPGESPLPGPGELAARLETQRRLAGLVAGLEEPLRSTVLLRFYEGISSAEIARRTGVPEGTVRWRLKRALDALRDRLDREHGGNRRAWMIALAPLARKGAVPAAAGAGGAAAAAAAGGAILMTTATKVAIGAAAAVLLAVGFASTGFLGVGAPAGPTHARVRPAPDPAAGPSVPAPEGGGPAPAEVAAPEPVRREGPPDPREVLTLGVEGRTVDERGTPVAGAIASLHWWSPDGEASEGTGADGRFRVEASHAGTAGWGESGGRWLRNCRFLVRARGWATVDRTLDLVRDEVRDLGDIVLEPGGSVSGRVVDGTGAPVAGAWVGAEDPESAMVPIPDRHLWRPEQLTNGPTVATDPTGAFLLEGIPVGSRRLWAGAEGFRAGRSEALEVRVAAETPGAEIRLERTRAGDFVRGRVVAPDGEPVARPHLWFRFDGEGRSTSSSAVVGGDGTFRIPVPFPSTCTLVALDLYGRWGPGSPGAVEPGTGEVDIRLAETRPVFLRVRSREGAAVERWTAYMDIAGRHIGSWYAVKPEVHPRGEAPFLVPTFPFLLEVRAEGYATSRLGPFDPGSLPGSLDAVLDPLGAVRGRVLSDRGPVAGAVVTAQRAIPPGSMCIRDGLPLRWYADAEGEARTAEDGSFSLTIPRAGSFVFRAEAAGFAPGEVGPTEVDPQAGRDGVEVRLGPGGSIEGRVVLPPGRGPDGVIVLVSRGDGHPRTVKVGPEGSYRFEGLTPGPWSVRRHDREYPAPHRSTTSAPGTSDIDWSCRVEEGRTTRFDLDLSGTETAVVRGSFRPAAGEGNRGWTAALLPGEDGFPPPVGGPVAIDLHGTFTLAAPEAGSFRVVLAPHDGSFRLLDGVSLVPGENAWSLVPDLAFGRLEGSVATEGMHAFVWEGSGSRWALGEIRAGPDGRFSLPLVPAGRVRLVRIDPAAGRPDPDPRRWPAAEEVEVPAGGTVTVDL